MQQVMPHTERQKNIPYGIEAHCGFGAPQSTQSVRDKNTSTMGPLIADGAGRAGPDQNWTHSYCPDLPVS